MLVPSVPSKTYTESESVLVKYNKFATLSIDIEGLRSTPFLTSLRKFLFSNEIFLTILFVDSSIKVILLEYLSATYNVLLVGFTSNLNGVPLTFIPLSGYNFESFVYSVENLYSDLMN